MNIESIQAGSPSPRVVAPDTSRKEKVVSAPSPVPQSNKIENQQAPAVEQHKLSVEDAVKRLADFVSPSNANIKFTVDEASGIRVVKITDSQTNEVIRQLPSEETIRIAQALETLQGLFVKEKA